MSGDRLAVKDGRHRRDQVTVSFVVSAADISRPHSALTVTIDNRAFVYHANSERIIIATSLTQEINIQPRELHTANMSSSDKVLVYHHRHNASNPIIPNGLEVITTSELDTILQNRNVLHAHHSNTVCTCTDWGHRSGSAAQFEAHR